MPAIERSLTRFKVAWPGLKLAPGPVGIREAHDLVAQPLQSQLNQEDKCLFDIEHVASALRLLARSFGWDGPDGLFNSRKVKV